MATKKSAASVRPEPVDSGPAAPALRAGPAESKVEPTDVATLLAELSAQVTALTERLARLEGTAAPVPPAAPAPALAAEPQPAPTAAPPAPAPAPELAEEELLAVSAALAAFFGVRMRIRNIRLLSSQAWAQQGRVSIQASHRLHN